MNEANNYLFYYLMGAMLYFGLGLLRTMFKAADLATQGKISARNDDFAAFKYMIKQPTFGDILFMPVQLIFLALALLTLALITLFLKIIS